MRDENIFTEIDMRLGLIAMICKPIIKKNLCG